MDADSEAPLAHDRAERARVCGIVEAYAPVMPPYAFLAGRTALVWHGVAVDHGPDLEIGVIEPDRAVRRRGIRPRTLSRHLVTVRAYAGVRAASPASSWAMLGGSLDVRGLVRAGDQLARIPRDRHGIRRPHAQLATLAPLTGAVYAGRRVGIAALREALAAVRTGSMSPLETDLRLDLTAAGLSEPELDVEIRTPGGLLIGIADAAYRRERVLVEVEGDHHRTSRAQWTRDLEKHAGYAQHGWRLVRLSSALVRDPGQRGVELVRAALHPR